jgi:hypothetical protein
MLEQLRLCSRYYGLMMADLVLLATKDYAALQQIQPGEGRRSQGLLDGCLAASHLWRDKRCPQNDPILIWISSYLAYL